MHVMIVEILRSWAFVSVSAKACDSLISQKYVHTTFCFASDYYVYTEIELQAVDKVRIAYVSLNNNWTAS